MDWIVPGLLTCILFSHHGSFARTESSKLVGSSKPIFALVGQTVTLPCQVEPPSNVAELQVKWSRADLNPEMYVHFQRNGHEEFAKKLPSYRYRTALFTDKLKIGNGSLKLDSVKLYDEGNYTCEIPSKNLKSVIQLIVGAVSQPEVSIMEPNGTGRVLQCVARSWHPEPEVEWREKEGPIITNALTKTVKDTDGCYTLTSYVTVYRTATNEYTCRVHLDKLNQTREDTIKVPADIFKDSEETKTRPSNSGNLGWIAFVILLAAVAVAVAVGVFVFFPLWKRRRNKTARVDTDRQNHVDRSNNDDNRLALAPLEPVASADSNTVDVPEETTPLLTPDDSETLVPTSSNRTSNVSHPSGNTSQRNAPVDSETLAPTSSNSTSDVSRPSEGNTSQINAPDDSETLAPDDSETLESVETSLLSVPVQETQPNVLPEPDVSVQETLVSVHDIEPHVKTCSSLDSMTEDDLMNNRNLEQNTVRIGLEEEDLEQIGMETAQ